MHDAVQPESPVALPQRLLRRVLPLAMGLVLLAGIGGGVRLALSLGQPFPGLALMWRKELKLYTVGLTTSPDWPGLAAGMEINDRILCIDGYHPAPEALVYGLDPRYKAIQCPLGGKPFADVFRQQFESSTPAVAFLVDRSGEIRTVPNVPLVRFTPVMLAEAFLPSFLLGLGLLAVGATVYFANPTAETNLVFTLFVLIIAATVMDQSYSAIISDRLAYPWLASLLLFALWIPLLGATLFHLTGLLAVEGPWPTLVRRLRLPYYIVSVLFSLVGLASYVIVDKPASVLLDWSFGYFFAASCVLAGVWSVISLAWTWRKTSSRRTRRQVGLILPGMVVMIAYLSPYLAFFFTNAPTPRYSQSIQYVGLGFVALVAYAILRYQLFASKARSLTTLLVAIWCILAANLVYLLLGQTPGFWPILAAALVTSLGLVARWGPTAFFTRLLRRGTVDYQTVARFSRRVGKLQSIESLLLAAGQSLQEDLDAAHVDVWLLDEERQVVQRFCDGRLSGSTIFPPQLVQHLGVEPDPVHASKATGDYANLVAASEAARVAVWAPLVERGQAVGLLGLGPRWTGEVYDERDLQLIGILARQMALAILNTRQFERLQATSRLIQQAEENERLKMARELHDTILQFLLVLTYGLDDLKERETRISAEIEQWQDRIGTEASRLRDMLSYLRAPEVLVQRGLIASLQSWLGQIRSSTEICIEADLSPSAEEALSVEAQVAVYRVFREAINNALKYSQGSHISVRLQREGEEIRFCIEDDGQGFDVASALAGGGKGYSSLQDMRTYVENVGGALVIRSVLGKGTIIDGQVPVKAIAVTG
jgi:signal transduction histidine kinase